MPPLGAAVIHSKKILCAVHNTPGAKHQCLCGLYFCTDVCAQRAQRSGKHTKEDCFQSTLLQIKGAVEENRYGMNQQYKAAKKETKKQSNPPEEHQSVKEKE